MEASVGALLAVIPHKFCVTAPHSIIHLIHQHYGQENQDPY